MKRKVSILLIIVVFVNLISIHGHAAEITQNKYYCDDGSYFIVEISRNVERSSGNITGNKTYTYYNSDNSAQWRATLTASFNYTGSSSTCTNAYVSVDLYDSDWYVSSKYASKSGNVATASVTVGRRVAGITMTSVPVNLRLTCDKSGNLS